MVQFWQEIVKDELTYITPALALLRNTTNGYAGTTEAILNDKLQPPKPSPDDPNSNTANHCLRLWSYGDRRNPLVSAFFFLRRRQKKGHADASGLWANCLTVGVQDVTAGGLSKDDLIDALNEVCGLMNDFDPAIKLELMYLDPLVLRPQNLKDAFAQMFRNAQPPKRKPRFEDKGTITLGLPWVPEDSAGNEVFMDFKWLLIVPKP
jgi:hypothetical protein